MDCGWECLQINESNHPLKYFWCVHVCSFFLLLLSCCLFIIDTVLATSIFANYLSTCIHADINRKSTKKQDIALGERQQDKQHPTSKFQSPFLLCASSSPCLSSYLCLFYSVLVLLLTFIFLSLLLHFQSLPNPSHMLFALCSFPLSVPASFHLSVPLFSTHLFFVAQFSCPVLIGNF